MSAPKLRRFERDAGLVMLGTTVANASTYVYHVLISRHLGPAAYGALGAVLGLAVIAGVPSSGLQFALARRVAVGDPLEDADVVSSTIRAVLGVSLVGVSVLLLAAWPLATFLRVELLSTVWLAIWFVPLVVGPVLLGALQGRRLFGWLAASAVLLGVGRVLGALVVSGFGLGVTASVAVMAVAALASAGLAWLVVRPSLSARRAEVSGLVREVVQITVPFVGLAALAGLDVVLARRLLAPRAAGYYVAAAVAGKVVFWAPASISVVGFAEFARDPTDDHLRRALVAVGGIALAAVAGVLLLRVQLIGIIFGREFLPAAQVVFLVAVAMAGLAVAQVLTTWAIARQMRGLGATLLGAAALLVVLVLAIHRSPAAIAGDLLLVSAITTSVLAIRVSRARRASASLGVG